MISVEGSAPEWAHALARDINGEFDQRGVVLQQYTVATLPSPAKRKHGVVKVTNGDTGSPCLAYSDGATWFRVVLGAAVSI